MHPDLQNASILVFANKSDLPVRRTAAELIDLYALGITSHEIQVIECSAITGAGL
jgi:signal recognition particle receptor subunit beta